ncbi:transketolase [Larsenimonas suaedae]|uniref:Transketolase n=1 Tax=Larsenimonas suaedae TaxID=1851019 RepID=A0ABU1GR15_9GAMM|nr:transketolase [Larsenimonas suaedae]MCM2972737.1 transketolase [Larsenimonas suaedae]MDR5894466.1 transketolase [Larsenimonas suaedae]
MSSRRQLANALRALSMDAVQKANSGHPGMPMGMADIAEVLWNDHLKHNPANPDWADRDRFILSNGHGSMLHYALLHLSGYDLPMEELKNFRQLGSKTPGHPEHGYTPGIETTTGPLGQGLANGVGMAVAERTLAAQFNRDGFDIVNHRTWVFAGDGCLMEGISHEACSLAGTLGLGNLVVFYDDNGISIDGEVKDWFTDDTAGRFRAYGWHVIDTIDGHDHEQINRAIEEAKDVTDKPTLIICKTVIGFGSPNKAGKEESHGAALGDDEIVETRKQLGWEYDAFEIPDEIYSAWDAREQGQSLEDEYNRQMAEYEKANPELAQELKRRYSGELPPDFDGDKIIKQAQEKQEKTASRKASLGVLNEVGPNMPELFGGSADLAPSNLTLWDGAKAISKGDFDGNYLHYGVREFGMGAIANGIATHGGFVPYDATFLVFMEYMHNAVRMSALSHTRILHVFTHDSIGLGEDGPTHQPIEQLADLRNLPGLHTWRPCDATETAAAWVEGLKREKGPTALIFSRQNLAGQARNDEQLANIRRGGYVLKDADGGAPELILIATGSEVEIAMDAAQALEEKGRKVRVVSMPCTTLFDEQDAEYRNAVLPNDVRKRLAIEAAIPSTWYKYVGLDGDVIGMTSYGESGKAEDLFKHFGFTVDNVIKRAEALS